MNLSIIVAGLTAVASGLKLGLDAVDIGKSTLNAAKSTNTKGSLTSFLGKYIIEPTAIITDDLSDEEITEQLLSLQVDIFSGFYMQVFEIITKVNNLDASTAVTMLSDKTDFSAMGITRKLNTEDFDYVTALANEERLVDFTMSYEPIDLGTEAGKPDSGSGAPTIIQREFSVTMDIKNGTNSHQVKIPILVKLNVLYVKTSSILNIIGDGGYLKTKSGRWDEYKAGGISLYNFIFADDMIKEYKQSKLRDEDDLHVLINKGKTAATSKIFSTGEGMGFSGYYHMLLISVEAKATIERTLKGKISKDKYKEKLCEYMGALTITVVDQDYERVVIYTKDISGKSDVTFKALSKKSGGSGMDDVIKAILSGRPPVF